MEMRTEKKNKQSTKKQTKKKCVNTASDVFDEIYLLCRRKHC